MASGTRYDPSQLFSSIVDPTSLGHRAYLTACERPKLEAHLQDRLAVGEK